LRQTVHEGIDAMSTNEHFAAIGSLIGDPARGAMLLTLMDGRAFTATELAVAAGIAPSTASSHLARLISAGLLEVLPQGRHRYHRLASPEVARMVESVMAVAGAGAKSRPLVTGPRDVKLRFLRTCYDHLAGRVSVVIAERLVELGHIDLQADGGRITDSGQIFFERMGVELSEQRTLIRSCLDWSERRWHVGGGLGAALQQALLSSGSLRRCADSRALEVTPRGRRRLQELFGFELSSLTILHHLPVDEQRDERAGGAG
jgi:DNA-binding transcriptional ArsR family regulator